MKKIILAISSVLIVSAFFLTLHSDFIKKEIVKKVSDENSDAFRKIFDDVRHNGLLVIYGTGNSEYTGVYANQAEKYKNNFGRFLKIEIKPDTSVTNAELKNKSIFLIGTYNSNEIIKKIPLNYPISISSGKFEFNSFVYNKPGDIISAACYNPFNNSKLCFLTSGTNDGYVSSHFNHSLRFNFRIARNGKTRILGEFKIENHNWVISSDNYFSFNQDSIIISPVHYFRYILNNTTLSKNKLNDIVYNDSLGFTKLQTFFGSRFKSYNVKVDVFGSFEDKGLIINDTHLSSIDTITNSVEVVVNNDINGDDFKGQALLLIRNTLGIPRQEILENGLAIHFSNNWRGSGYEYWAAREYFAGFTIPLSELLNPDKMNYESVFIKEPLEGSFVDFLISKYGKEDFINKYKYWNPSKQQIEKLNSQWINYLNKISHKYSDQIKKDRESFPEPDPGFQKGFSYAHVGYNIYNGYLSKKSLQSLHRLVELNVNAISITPFTSIRNPNLPEPLSFWESPGEENDETLIFLQEAADKLGLTVMLKPHIWVGRNGWPGDIQMLNNRDWDKFFEYYYKWIRHYALLAEIYKIPILCLGNELSNATVGHEDYWVKMVEKIRKIYSGKITYGANWDNEFQKLMFWNAFDYMGVSEYYPLSVKDNPTDKDLFEGAKSVIEKIKNVHDKFHKPVLFTEVGYRSSIYPWKTALEGNPQTDTTLENQARCYYALFKAGYGQSWLSGMYWWKWPSYLSYGFDSGRDLYIPLEKPAETVIKEWYSKSW